MIINLLSWSDLPLFLCLMRFKCFEARSLTVFQLAQLQSRVIVLGAVLHAVLHYTLQFLPAGLAFAMRYWETNSRSKKCGRYCTCDYAVCYRLIDSHVSILSFYSLWSDGRKESVLRAEFIMHKECTFKSKHEGS